MNQAALICTRHKTAMRMIHVGHCGSGGYFIQTLHRCIQCAEQARQKVRLEKDRYRRRRIATLYEGLP